MQQVHPVRKIGYREFGGHGAMVHQIKAVRDLGGKAEVLFHQHHGHAALFQFAQHVANGVDDDRGQPLRRLVEEAAGRSLDIVGPDVLSFGQMIERIAEAMMVRRSPVRLPQKRTRSVMRAPSRSHLDRRSARQRLAIGDLDDALLDRDPPRLLEVAHRARDGLAAGADHLRDRLVGEGHLQRSSGGPGTVVQLAHKQEIANEHAGLIAEDGIGRLTAAAQARAGMSARRA